MEKSELQIVHSDSNRCLAQAFISSVLTHSNSWIIPAAIINTLHLTEAHSRQDLSTINRGKHQLRSMHHRESSCPPHCYPSSIHPPSLKNREPCICMMGNLLQIWQPYVGIYSAFMSVIFLVFLVMYVCWRGGGLWKHLHLCTCLFSQSRSIVFEANPRIVKLLTVLHLARTSERQIVWWIFDQRGFVELVQTTSLHIYSYVTLN